LPGGLLFSLFISDVTINDLLETSVSKLQVYPNPFEDELKVNTQSESVIVMCDITGNETFTGRVTTGKNALKTQNLVSGATS
jgi:hypothetical protein